MNDEAKRDAGERAAKAAYLQQNVGQINRSFEHDFMTVFTNAVVSTENDYHKDIMTLIDAYVHSPDHFREEVDHALCAVCGWSLGTLVAQTLGTCPEGEEPDWNLDLRKATRFSPKPAVSQTAHRPRLVVP